MGPLPLMLVHMSFNFPDLHKLHAEAEMRDFSRVLKPMGYMPLTGEHNMGAISAAWHRDKGSILRDAQDERERAMNACSTWYWSGKGQDLLSPLHQAIRAAFTPRGSSHSPRPRVGLHRQPDI